MILIGAMQAHKKIEVVGVRDVHKSYRLGKHEVKALKGVDLTVSCGDFLAIAGSSGSGKTTLLNLIGCLDRPSRGEITIDGLSTVGATQSQLSKMRASKIGFIFQNFNLIPTLTALENVEYPLLILGDSASTRRHKAEEALASVGLGGFLKNRPSTLSGGQQQRVAIARAMVKKPALILADEPTASLDQTTAREILSLMRVLNREHGTSFILSSHDPSVLASVDRVFHLVDGLAVGDHRPGELRRVA